MINPTQATIVLLNASSNSHSSLDSKRLWRLIKGIETILKIYLPQNYKYSTKDRKVATESV